MWRVVFLDWEHPGMWLAFEHDGESSWDTREEALRACRHCAHPGAHVVFEHDFTVACQ